MAEESHDTESVDAGMSLDELLSDEGGEIQPAAQGEVAKKSDYRIDLTKLLRQKLKDVHPKHRMTYADMLIHAVLTKAINGNARCMQMVWDRIEGPVAQRLAGPDGGPIQFEAIIAALGKAYPEKDVIEVEAKLANERGDQ